VRNASLVDQSNKITGFVNALKQLYFKQ